MTTNFIDQQLFELKTSSLKNGAFLCWKNLSIGHKKSFLSCRSSKKSLILNCAYGYAEPGKVTCIGGQAGSGKSLLLNYFYDIMDHSLKSSGEVFVNGVQKKLDFHIAELVPDYDRFPEFTTVKEHIDFYAQLKLKNRYTDQQIKEKVDNLIKLFNFESKKNVMLFGPDNIANENDGLNAQEMRTLSLILGMVAEKNILLIDSPFKFADYFYIKRTLQILKQYAITYHISVIIATNDLNSVINNSDIIDTKSIDQIPVNEKDDGVNSTTISKQVSGTNSIASNKKYIDARSRTNSKSDRATKSTASSKSDSDEKSNSITKKDSNAKSTASSKKDSNVKSTVSGKKDGDAKSKSITKKDSNADLEEAKSPVDPCTTSSPSLVDIVIIMQSGCVSFCGDITGDNMEKLIKPEFERSSVSQLLEQECKCTTVEDMETIIKQAANYTIPQKNTSFLSKLVGDFGAPLLTQLVLLTKRRIKKIMRDHLKLFFSFYLFIASAVFLSLGYSLYHYEGHEAEKSGDFIFIEMVCISMVGLIYGVYTTYSDIEQFTREYRFNIYGSGLLYVEKLLAEIPLNVILCTCYTLICYYVVGLRPSIAAYIIHTIYVFYSFEAAVSVAQLLCSNLGSLKAITALVTSICPPLLAISSHLMKEGDIPIYMRWLKYVPWIFYGFESMEIINFKDAKIPNHHESLVQPIVTTNYTTAVLSNGLTNANDFIDGNTFLPIFVSHPELYHVNFVCILTIGIGFRLLAILMLKLKTLHGRVPF